MVVGLRGHEVQPLPTAPTFDRSRTRAIPNEAGIPSFDHGEFDQSRTPSPGPNDGEGKRQRSSETNRASPKNRHSYIIDSWAPNTGDCNPSSPCLRSPEKNPSPAILYRLLLHKISTSAFPLTVLEGAPSHLFLDCVPYGPIIAFNRDALNWCKELVSGLQPNHAAYCPLAQWPTQGHRAEVGTPLINYLDWTPIIMPLLARPIILH